MNVHWVQVDAIRYAPTPLEAMCAVATLDTKFLSTIKLVWVRNLCMGYNLMLRYVWRSCVLFSANNKICVHMYITRDCSTGSEEERVA